MLRYAWAALLVIWLAGSPVIGQVTATLLFDKPEYLLGENILAHYRMTNGQGDFYFGNDAGSGWRTPRWIVTATDAAGREAPDPCSPQTVFFTGGIIMGPSVLLPGKTFEYTLPLMRYCDFPGPGVYTVRVYHTAEWGIAEPSRRTTLSVLPTPAAEGTLELRMPTPEEAVGVVREMRALPKKPDLNAREKPFADFTALRYPVYLPILEPLAAEGDLRAMTGLGAMAAPEATRALLHLAVSDTRPVAWRARYYLLQRLPNQGDPEPALRFGPCFPIWPPNAEVLVRKVQDEDAQRLLLATQASLFESAPIWRDIIARSWEKSTRLAVYDLALRLLTEEDIDERLWGAKLLKRVGDAGNLPLVLGMIDRLLPELPEDGQPLDAPGQQLCRALQETAGVLVQTGAELPDPAESLAAKLALLDEVHRNARYRPPGWQQVAAELLQHRLLYVRLSAAYDLPAPLDPQLVAPALALTQARAPETDAAFCRIAKDAPRPEFAGALREMLATAREEWLIVWSSHAAPACGVPVDRMLDILIARIDDPSVSQRVLNLLVTSTMETHGLAYRGGVTDPPEELGRLKTRWTAFVNDHRANLRAGTRFPIGSEAVSADLLPGWLSLVREDRTQWPQRTN